MKLLFDADSFVYRHCFASQRSGVFSCDGETQEVTLGDPVTAYSLVMGEISKVVALYGGKPVIYLSDPHDCFRKDIYPEYKANRAKNARPHGYWEVREMLIQDAGATWEPRLEADDLLGLNSAGDTLMVSEDKDLLTVPGEHFNPRTGERCTVSTDEADHIWMMQTLTGDSCDGYPGIPGVGPVRAEGILGPYELAISRYPDLAACAYKSEGLTRDDFLTQARLARILRPGEYENGQVKLWEPA